MSRILSNVVQGTGCITMHTIEYFAYLLHGALQRAAAVATSLTPALKSTGTTGIGLINSSRGRAVHMLTGMLMWIAHERGSRIEPDSPCSRKHEKSLPCVKCIQAQRSEAIARSVSSSISASAKPTERRLSTTNRKPCSLMRRSAALALWRVVSSRATAMRCASAQMRPTN